MGDINARLHPVGVDVLGILWQWRSGPFVLLCVVSLRELGVVERLYPNNGEIQICGHTIGAPYKKGPAARVGLVILFDNKGSSVCLNRKYVEIIVGRGCKHLLVDCDH